jgi:hypothetical protein
MFAEAASPLRLYSLGNGTTWVLSLRLAAGYDLRPTPLILRTLQAGIWHRQIVV